MLAHHKKLFEKSKKDIIQLDCFEGLKVTEGTGNKMTWREHMKLQLQKTVTVLSSTELEKTADKLEFELDILVCALAKHASSLT
eukprot:4433682-Ditylum_brightwellii.AAC.1